MQSSRVSTGTAGVTTKEASRQTRAAWLALSLVVGMVTVVYLSLSLSVSADPVLMPLDDTYIHFQYARQLAQGEPLVYSPGDPATSGGTSLVYPAVLAAGYLLGFTAWSLAYWALGIGVLAWWGATWLVYLIGRRNPLTTSPPRGHGYALSMAFAFAVSGPVAWAALSGMETTLFVFVVLLTLAALQRERYALTLVAATLMTLTRPEGLILSGIVAVALALMWTWPRAWSERIRRAAWLSVPVVAGGVQPVINVLATGSASSSGMQAKSHLYNTSIPLGERLTTVADFFGRTWAELLRGRSPDFGAFTSPVLAEVALAVCLIGAWVAWRRRRVNLTVVVLAWIVALTAAIATLDTAFWQFKRYQLPVMALFFPLAAWGAEIVGESLRARRWDRIYWARWIVPTLVVVPALLTTVTFARNYLENITVVHDQQVPMARWVAEHLPADARIGVHDVGLMGYFADQPLYDVVGLTTRGPAESWRQGPGAIFEHMAHSEIRPDYFAIYPDVQGLRYLLNAGVMGTVLQEFPVTLPPHNVAAALDYQAVYEASWSNVRDQELVAQRWSLPYLEGMTLADWVDVANLDSESDHDYEWAYADAPPGFVTEVFRYRYAVCGRLEPDCTATDGGRVLTGSESFTLHTRPGEDVLLVTRLHGRTSVPLSIYVDGHWLADRVQPGVPGHWVEVMTWIPAALVQGDTIRVRIEPAIADSAADAYSPYYHWAYQGSVAIPEPLEQEPVATFGENQVVRLLEASVSDVTDGRVDVRLVWEGDAAGAGDGVVFVHLYDNINQPPVAQAEGGDRRPGDGVWPPGNWLPGTIEDTYTLVLPDDLAPGTYRVAIGLYDPRAGRLAVSGPQVDADRLFIGEITVEESMQ